MWRYVAGGVAAALLIVAGVMFVTARARPGPVLPQAPARAAAADGEEGTTLPDTVPEASDRTREEKRFGRYDKDRDGQVSRDEYLAARRKAFAKLDVNGDGRLSFEEWAIKATTKFATADHDRSGVLTPAEFATTAVKRKPARRAPCPPAQPEES